MPIKVKDKPMTAKTPAKTVKPEGEKGKHHYREVKEGTRKGYTVRR